MTIVSDDGSSAGMSETGKLFHLTQHPLRAAILNEVHARPFAPLATPKRILHFGFLTDEAGARADRQRLGDTCVGQGTPGPQPFEKHFRVPFGPTSLRWEQHSEFTTYTWETPADVGDAPFTPNAATLESRLQSMPPPGPLLVAIDLHILPQQEPPIAIERCFDRPSLAIAENADGKAIYATDFRIDASGFVRILIVDRGLDQERAGALVQRVLEVETYRTLALLALPEAQRLSPSIAKIERRLAEVTNEMRKANDLASNRHLLDELTALAADLEAGAAASVYRFGATRAYDEIMRQRLQTIGERKTPGISTWTSFLARRMAPAMRTCATTVFTARRAVAEAVAGRGFVANSRQCRTRKAESGTAEVDECAHAHAIAVADHGGRPVGRGDHLLRRRSVRISRQSAARGPSVPFDPAYMIAVFIPIAAFGIWSTVRRIRKHHITHDD